MSFAGIDSLENIADQSKLAAFPALDPRLLKPAAAAVVEDNAVKSHERGRVSEVLIETRDNVSAADEEARRKREERLERVRMVQAAKRTELPGPGSYEVSSNDESKGARMARLWAQDKAPRLKKVERDILGPGMYDVLDERHVQNIASTVFKTRSDRFKLRLDDTDRIGPGTYELTHVARPLNRNCQSPWIATVQGKLQRMLEQSVLVKTVPVARIMSNEVSIGDRYIDKLKSQRPVRSSISPC